MIDDRVLVIVKAVALDTAIYSDDWSDSNCPFCSASDEIDVAFGVGLLKHDSGCKVVLARLILKELGMPVRIYKVEFDVGKKHIKRYVLATNEEEAIQDYKHYRLQQNIRATIEREL